MLWLHPSNSISVLQPTVTPIGLALLIQMERT